VNVSRSVDEPTAPGATRPTGRTGCLIAAAVVVAASIAAFFAVWWWLAPKGPWVAPLNALGCQGVSLDRPAPTTGHDLRCSVFSPGRIAPSCDRIVTTYTTAGGPTNGGVRVIVGESGQERVACSFGEDGRRVP